MGYNVTIVKESETERQELIKELGQDPGIRYHYFIYYTSSEFLAWVRKYLPKRDITLCNRDGVVFHDCGVGFRCEELARATADLRVLDLLNRLDSAGHPWIESCVKT